MKDNKDIKLAKALGLVDEEYITEAYPKINIKKPMIRVARKVLVIAACVAAVMLLGMMALRIGPRFPYGEFTVPEESSTELPSSWLDKYGDSAHFDTILSIEGCNTKNAFSTSGFELNSGGSGNSSQYIEVTDNQVDGVIEGDLIKRTDKHLFSVSLEKNDSDVYEIYIYAFTLDRRSTPISTYLVTPPAPNGQYTYEWIATPEILLSKDGKTLTLLASLYGRPSDDLKNYKEAIFETAAISFDVSDPTKIVCKNIVQISGFLLTSRKNDSSIVLFTCRNLYYIDYDRPQSYLPFIDKQGELEYFSQEDIILPENLTQKSYTAITVFDEDTLEIDGTKAYYGYVGIPYVTEELIFLPYSYYAETEEEQIVEREAKTDVLIIHYGKDYLEKFSEFTVNGFVTDQYDLDFRKDILRVVTTTDYTINKLSTSGSILSSNRTINANLYCIDLYKLKIVGKVIGFAPDGETVQSVRFEETKAYVCTAEIVTLADPVYFFDLSDPSNITYTDTEVIPGYSTSLVELAGGYLLGIGCIDGSTLKLEVYAEQNGEVVPVCNYIRKECTYPESYKSYYIDREKGLIGLCVVIKNNRENESRYLLIKFDGTRLYECKNIYMQNDSYPDLTRAFVDDGYIYIVSRGNLVFSLMK